MPRRFSAILLTFFALFAFSGRALAQSWSFDARTIGMGGVGAGNLATKMIDSERNYTAIVIPIGLFQVLSNTDVFDPNNKKFDPILAVEYAATPFSYVIGRGSPLTPAETLFSKHV